MAETATNLVIALARRIRDPANTAHPIASVITLLSHIQRVINSATGAVKTSATLTLASPYPQNLYDTSVSPLTAFDRIERVTYQNDDLERGNWREMHAHDPYWATAAGVLPREWDRIGRGLLVVTPSLVNAGASVVCTGTKALAALTTGASATEMPDNHMPAILAMGEQLLLMRQRLMASVKPSVEQLDKMLPKGMP